MRKPVIAVAAALATTTLAAGTALAAPGAKAQTEAFTFGGSNPNHLTLIVHGAITAAGYDVSPDGPQYDIVHLPGGTFHVNHPDKDSKYSGKVNAKTCYASFTESGKYTISAGTGKYKGITGHGTYTGSGEGILHKTKKGACDQNAEPVAYYFTVHASGPITLK